MELRDRARAWAEHDPDLESRLVTLVHLDDDAWIAEHFTGRLSFGTAGMRGPLGIGPAAMNRMTVRRVTAALAAWAKGGSGPVVVGYDGRRGSAEFAEDAARVLMGAGIPAMVWDGVCPTPLLAFAVRFLGARAGVMVTASHNPPGDNGYKVYGADGAQIVPPADGIVSAHLDALPVGELPLSELPLVRVPAAVEEAWRVEVLGLRVHDCESLRIVYTPLHGVGGRVFLETLGAAGYTDLHVVAEQFEPDGAFPTVAFPNPEEPGALDRAFALAARVNADLVLANDPDADRIAVAIPSGRGWRALDGNEVGTLLAEDLLANGPVPEDPSARLVATTIVSSRLLSRIAARHGVRYAETLTGFKWIARAGLDTPGVRFVLGYEEALGVSAGEVVRDKDGLSAALLVADLASAWRSRGGLAAALDALARTYGVHRTGQRSFTLPGADGRARIDATMAALREAPPTEVDGRLVLAVVDTRAGTRTDRLTGAVAPIGLPPSDVLGFELEGGARVLVRPSGTEPKLKMYVEVVEEVGDDGVPAARARANDALERAKAAIGAWLR